MKDIPPFYEKLIRKVKAPVMIDTTDPHAIELALTYCKARRSSTRSTSKTAKRSSNVFARWRRPMARPWWSARSTKTSCRPRHSLANGNWRSRSAPSTVDHEIRYSSRRHHHRSAGVPMRHRRRKLHRRRSRDDRSMRLIKENIPHVKTVLGYIEYLLRPACGRARGRQFGLPVLLHQGRVWISRS